VVRVGAARSERDGLSIRIGGFGEAFTLEKLVADVQKQRRLGPDARQGPPSLQRLVRTFERFGQARQIEPSIGERWIRIHGTPKAVDGLVETSRPRGG